MIFGDKGHKKLLRLSAGRTEVGDDVQSSVKEKKYIIFSQCPIRSPILILSRLGLCSVLWWFG